MSFLRQNNERAKKNNNFGVLPVGEYELLITGSEHVKANTGTEGAQIVLTVRSDVEQTGQGRKLWHTFWYAKKGASADKQETAQNIIEAFNLNIGTPDGVEFETEEQWLKYIVGKAVRAKTKIEEYNGNEYARIRYFMPSENPDVAADAVPEKEEKSSSTKTTAEKFGDPFANDSKPIDISDDDLPF